MPVEIKELVIRTNIVADKSQSASVGALSTQEKQEIIQHCVDQVMKRMKTKNER